MEYFINYFEVQFNEADSLKADLKDFKKILYFTIIDALSKSIFPSEGNRERIIKFLENIVSWEEGQLFSLPHLYEYFKYLLEPQFSEIKDFINKKYNHMKHGWVYTVPEIDISISELKKFDRPPIVVLFDKKYNGSLFQFQHLNLFYKYRNSLIHEMKPLGIDNKRVLRQDIPHYLSWIDNPSDKNSSGEYWHLSYPETFLRNICLKAINQTKEYLVKNGIDPFSETNKGYFWIEKLN